MDLMRAGSVPACSSRTEAGSPGASSRLQGAFGGATVALSAAAGLLVGLRSVVALGAAGVLPLLALPPIPREGMGISWTPEVVWPTQLQHVALIRMAAVILGLFLAAMAVAVLNALVLLAEAGASRRREVAVRSALGAPPRTLLGLFLADVGRLLALSLVLGLLLGLAAGGALRSLWPGELVRLGAPGAAETVALGLIGVGGIAALAYLWVGLTVGWGTGLSPELGAGERATEDPAGIFRRRVLSAVQMGAAGSVALATLALSMSVRAPGAATGPGTTTVIPVTAPSAPAAGAGGSGDAPGQGAVWQALLDRLAKVPGMEAESVATPGTLVGLGVRDHATAQCGRCFIGQLPMPLWSVLADHYAVGPGYFSLAGRRLVSGRAFGPADGPSTKKVAVINETFARTAFESGRPLGHLVHLGRESGPWYEVVGVVEDAAPAAVGRDDLARPQIWVDALQQPIRHADVLLRDDSGTVSAAVALLGGAGYAPGEVRTLLGVRGAAVAPLAWMRWVAVALGLLTLLLAVHGARATALQVSRRRLRELAIRRVLGATDARILLFVLVGSARGALWGSALAVFFGSLVVALLQKAAGGIPSPGPSVYVAMVALLVAASVLASLKAAREAVAVEPAEAMA